MKQQILSTPEAISLERVSYLINKKGIDATIAHVDLEMVKMKLKDIDEGLGWTDIQCDIAEIEYKRFLHLNKKFPEFSIVPHTAMDLMWHQHILDTKAYHSDSQNIFGEYFHHFPYFGMRSESDQQDLTEAFDETQNLYAQEFGEEMMENDSSNCNSKCNSSGKCKPRKENVTIEAVKCTRNCVSRCTRRCKTKR